MKKQSKTEIRNNTAKAAKLLRGIDNEAMSIVKAQDALNKRVVGVQKTTAQVVVLLNGISTTALAASDVAPAKPVAKAAKKVAVAKAKSAVKPAKKVAVKKVAVAKAKPVVVAKKTEAKPKAPKPEKVKVPVEKAAKPAKSGERPPLIQLINNVLDKSPDVTAAEIYKQVTKEAGYFSRQSVYVHLKKGELYTKTGDGAAATFRRATATAATTKSSKTTSDEEAEAFVERAGSNPVTATVA